MEIKKEPGIQENLNNESEQANDTVDALPPLPTIDEVNPPLPDTESDDTQVTTLAAASTEIADGTENEMKPKKMKMESLVDDWFADVRNGEDTDKRKGVCQRHLQCQQSRLWGDTKPQSLTQRTGLEYSGNSVIKSGQEWRKEQMFSSRYLLQASTSLCPPRPLGHPPRQ
ncbi:hypothetical protein ScPMuIL_011567 [Solemya velum]